MEVEKTGFGFVHTPLAKVLVADLVRQIGVVRLWIVVVVISTKRGLVIRSTLLRCT